jgi:hypothetical protein
MSIMTRRSTLLGLLALAGCGYLKNEQAPAPVPVPNAPVASAPPPPLAKAKFDPLARYAGFLEGRAATAAQMQDLNWHATNINGRVNISRQQLVAGMDLANSVLRNGVDWKVIKAFFIASGVPESELGTDLDGLRKFILSSAVHEVEASKIDFSKINMSRVHSSGKLDLTYHRTGPLVAEIVLYWIDPKTGKKIYLLSLGCLNFIVWLEEEPHHEEVVSEPRCIKGVSGCQRSSVPPLSPKS